MPGRWTHPVRRGALTTYAFLALTATAVLMLRAVQQFLSAYSSILLPFATAGILSLLLRPAVHTLQKKTSLSPATAAIVVLLGFFIPL